MKDTHRIRRATYLFVYLRNTIDRIACTHKNETNYSVHAIQHTPFACLILLFIICCCFDCLFYAVWLSFSRC